MEMGGQYCSKKLTPARHQNNYQAPTNSPSIGDKFGTRYTGNWNSNYFCGGAFKEISK